MRALRAQGLSYRQIAQRAGVPLKRAWQLAQGVPGAETPAPPEPPVAVAPTPPQAPFPAPPVIEAYVDPPAPAAAPETPPAAPALPDTPQPPAPVPEEEPPVFVWLAGGRFTMRTGGGTYLPASPPLGR